MWQPAWLGSRSEQELCGATRLEREEPVFAGS